MFLMLFLMLLQVLESSSSEGEGGTAPEQIITAEIIRRPIAQPNQRDDVIDLKNLSRRPSDWGVQAPIVIPRTGTASPKLARDVRQVTLTDLCSQAHIYAHTRTYMLTRAHI